MKRLLSQMLVALLAITAVVVLTAGLASAGGWAMTSLDTAPYPVAGRVLAVGFTVRQHGATPVNPEGQVGVDVRSASGAEQYFPARQQGPTGHYVARVRIATAGVSHWQVRQGWFAGQDLGPITVARARTGGAAAADHASGTTVYRAPLALRVLLPVFGVALGAFAVADALLARRRRSLDLIAT